MFERLTLRRTIKATSAATAALMCAYDQLEAGNRVSSAAEFKAYGERFGVDTDRLMSDARNDLQARSDERAARKADRAAALARGRALL